MKAARTVLTLALVSFVAAPLCAAAGKKANNPTKETIAYYKTIATTLKPVTLTDDQTTKLNDLKKEYQQKFKDAYAKTDVRTPEQKKAGKEARKAAKEAGKKGRELNRAVAEAEKITEEQKQKAKEARQQLKALQGEFRDKVLGLLTDEQKKQIEAAKPKKRGKAAVK